MPELTPRTLNHFSFFTFKDAYFSLPQQERRQFHQRWLANLCQVTPHLQVYQVYPAQPGADFLVWSALDASQPQAASTFFEKYAQASNPFRHLLKPSGLLWGFTKPSQYTKTRSAQELDPFSNRRKPYLVIYPFVKTKEWYLMSREARQGMMNEHIRIGKGYPEITQLLLYSFGLQDQEFIVVYEMDDLAQFSELVYELRASQARVYTERDTPLYSAIYHPPADTLALWI